MRLAKTFETNLVLIIMRSEGLLPVCKKMVHWKSNRKFRYECEQ